MIEHGSAVNLVGGLHDLVYRHLGSRANVALVASPVFDASVQQIFAALCLGHTLCLVPDELRRDGAAMVRWLHDEQIHVCDCTPTLLGLMTRGGLAAQCGDTLRHVLVGGEPLPTDLVRELRATARGRRIAISNVYGPTECTVDVTAYTINESSTLPATPIVPIGRALRQCEIYVVADDGTPVVQGQPGELVLGGRCVGRGYVNDPDLTAQRFQPLAALGPGRTYRTGDLCQVNAQGDLEFLGRNDDQVKVLGHRIELGEVEHHLRAHPDIGAISVQARLTSRGYRELVAYVVSPPALTLSEIRAFAASRMPAYMIPAYFVPLEVLPLNTSGKIDRQALPDPETAASLPTGAEFRAAETPAERALRDVWMATLRLDEAGVHDNYFASGGDSIKALQLASRLRDVGWRVEIRDIFRYPTIEQLARHVLPIGAQPSEAGVNDEGESPLGATQRFFFDTYGPSAQYNQAVLLRARRTIRLDHLRDACAALLRAHGMLRARFVASASGWTQDIRPSGEAAPVVEYVDLRHRSSATADMLADAAAVQQRFALDRAPLWSVVLYDLGDGQRLLLTAHHLIIDGVSWRIVLEDLERALDALDAGRPASMPSATTPYGQWAAAQHEAARDGLEAERAIWLIGAAIPDAAVLPVEAPSRQADRRDVRRTLSPDLTRALVADANRAYATRVDELLVTGLALAWAEWSGEAACDLTLEGHGREPLGRPLDVSRTVGWFTSFYPVRVSMSADHDLGHAIKHVKETLRRIPNKGAGYGPLKYLSVPSAGVAPLPPLAFNYLGQFDATTGGWFEAAPERLGATASPDLPLPWPIDITAVVVDGGMEIVTAYSARRFEAPAVERLADAMVRALERIVAHAAGRGTIELTASDFDYAGITEESLDALLNTL
jgi:non-ribosomal peptide synthase protein (TIGR01720 family)